MQLSHIKPFQENTVYLIGGGPGDIGHLTMDAVSILSQSEVILHDMFLDSLQSCFPKAEWVHVGKQKGHHIKKQSEINEMLFHYVSSGKKTVRLKAGDASFFARSSEEIEYLSERKVKTLIIPGISSPQLLCEELNNSLTHRTLTRNLSFWSGYWDKEISENEIPLTDGHIIFMGSGQLQKIAEKLHSKGIPLNENIIIASNLGRNEKKIFYITVEDAIRGNIPEIPSPALIAAGFRHISKQ